MFPSNPLEIDYSEQESKDLLRKLMRCAVTGEFIHLSVKERSDLASFYEWLNVLLSEIYNPNQTAVTESIWEGTNRA